MDRSKILGLYHFDGDLNNYKGTGFIYNQTGYRSNQYSVSGNPEDIFCSFLDDGVFGKCAYLNGTNCLMPNPTYENASATKYSQISWDCWIKILSFSSNSMVWKYPSSFYLFYDGDACRPAISGVDPWDQQWHHYAVQFDNGIITVYIDGIKKGTINVSSSITEIGKFIILGANDPHNGGGYAEMLVDELRIMQGVQYDGNNFTPPTNPYLSTKSIANNLKVE